MPYIINTSADYADEFDYPIVSVMSDNLHSILTNLPFLYKDCDFEECYFGTNEYLSFHSKDIHTLIAKATYVDEPTFKLVTPFLTHASWDPLDRILDHICDHYDFDYKDLDNLSLEDFQTKYAQLFI